MSSYDKLLKAVGGYAARENPRSEVSSQHRPQSSNASMDSQDENNSESSDEAPESPKELDPSELDEHMLKFSQVLRSDVMEMFSTNKVAVLRKHQIQVRELKDSFNHQINLREGNIAELKEDIVGLSEKIEKSHGINMMLAGEIYRNKRLNIEATVRRKSFYLWKRNFDEYKRLHEIEQMVALPRRRAKRLIRVFSAWRSDSRKTHDQKNLDRWKNRVEYTSKKLIDKYEQSLSELRAELVQCQNSLADEEGKRQLVEQNMKRAFMRGVSALNLEAMSMFSRAPGATSDQQASGNLAQKQTLMQEIPTKLKPLHISGEQPPPELQVGPKQPYVTVSDMQQSGNVPLHGSGRIPRSPSRKYPRMPSRSSSGKSSFRELSDEEPRRFIPEKHF